MYTPPFNVQVFAMPKITDMQIRAWIKAGDRFEGRADGNGLYICYPKNYTVPFWRFRYKFAGKQRAMVIGSYTELSLSKARETAKELSQRRTKPVKPALSRAFLLSSAIIKTQQSA